MSNVKLDLQGGEVWLQVKVTPSEADKAPGPCHWVFDMSLSTTPNVTKDIPPIQDGPDQRPLAAPGTLIGSPAAWNLRITNLDNKPHVYTVVVRIFQIAPDGKETDVYRFDKEVEFDPASTDRSKPNPRNLSDGLHFVM